MAQYKRKECMICCFEKSYKNAMAEELTFFTGTLRYKEIDFIFSFDKNELRLVPPKEKKQEIECEWGWKPLGNGAFTFGEPMPVGVDFLIGECNETCHRIVFLPEQGATLEFYNSVVRIPLAAYVICKHNRVLIDRVSFTCPEINFIHPANQAISYTFPVEEFKNKGIVCLSTQEYERTTTEKQTFILDGKKIKAYFGISRVVSTKLYEPPLRLNSTLMFEFDAVEDYQFIYRLWWIAREFIRFLCYRKNVFISTVELEAPAEDGKHETFATMYLLGQDGETESDAINKGRYIKQVHIFGHEGEILSDIVDDNLYLRHLPESYQAGRHIDAARFVMITAAFEWEFHRFYPDGVEKSSATIEAEEAVSEQIQNHINETTGKKKEIYKFLKKLVKSASLQSEVIQIGKNFAGIIGAIGNHLYHLNGQKLDYAEMGQRLADQRNHFAHGDLDKDFIGVSLLDLIYLEFIVYAMQLKHYGVQDIEIQKSINELFHLNLTI